jgi:hypothetical protein
LRVCAVLGVTPNDLLIEGTTSEGAEASHLAALVSAASALSSDDLTLALRQIETLLAHRRERRAATEPR